MGKTNYPEGKEHQNKNENSKDDNADQISNNSKYLEKNSANNGADEKAEDEKAEERLEGQMPFEEHENEKKHVKTIKNLISAVIVLSGIAAGSFFVDIIQFIGGSGYSEKALKDAKVFVAGEKTWVAFDDPAVEVEVLTVADEELEDCANCDPEEVLLWLKRFIPTLISKKVIASSPEGENLIEKFNIKSIPAFVFSSEIEQSEFYEGEASVLFEREEDKFVLNSSGLGIPVGRFIETPKIEESDPILGDLEKSNVRLVAFLDFQCPYCKEYYSEVKAVVAEYAGEVAFVFKDLPLDFHPRAELASLAARCSQQQDKFWEMGDLLYENQDEWSVEEGTGIFKQYSSEIGLDTVQFNECVDDRELIGLIEDDIALAEEFGVSGTPATFINDQYVSGVVDQIDLKAIINRQLGRE